jgi:ATP-dependent DNA helicase RecG
MKESSTYDKKSLKFFGSLPKNWDWKELAKDCVAFANFRGGKICFGIEDDADGPPPGQSVPPEWTDLVRKNIGHHTVNVAVAVTIQTWENTGQTLVVEVMPNRQSVAATSDGRYYLRVGDESRPVMPDDLGRLFGDKDSYTWETQTSRRITLGRQDVSKTRSLLAAIRASNRVSEFVRQLPDEEILDHYHLTREGLLTNLGILWVGRREDRAMLLHPPSVQFIKFDHLDAKVAKRTWTDFELNPAELMEAIWSEIPEWRESTELPDGLFRKNIPHYDEVVIRELVANAIVHRPYTTRGDIFINLYPDRLEIHNPGLLPMGVTPQNILHQSVQRNPHLARLFYDLKLMEREGSGYDRLYDVLLSQAKPLPTVSEEHDRVVVTVERRIIRPEIVDLLASIDQQHQLRPRERISLGLIAQHGSLTALEFSRLLALDGEPKFKHWLGRLMDLEIVVRGEGRTKGAEYRINPSLLRDSQFKGKTTLKAIEAPRLRHLLLEDLRIHSPSLSHPSTLSMIHKRVGVEISRQKLLRALRSLVLEGVVQTTGKRGRGGGYGLCQPDFE